MTLVFNPVVYGGFLTTKINNYETTKINNYEVLSDWDSRPSKLITKLDSASGLVILDALSFPYEILNESHWEIPIVFNIPEQLTFDHLVQLFDAPVFQKLTFFDRFVCLDDHLWKKLVNLYGWSQSQRHIATSNDINELLSSVLHQLNSEDQSFSENLEYQAIPYWQQRGEQLASTSPHRAICSVHHDLRFNKSMHRVQEAVLKPQIQSILDHQAESERTYQVLELGCGIGRWAMNFKHPSVRYIGIDISEGMITKAQRNFPHDQFHMLTDSLIFSYLDESFDITFTVTVLHHNPIESKRLLISELFRVTKAGGKLLFLEDFVATRESKSSTVFPMSILDFVEMVQDITAGQVVLEHMETLRYKHVEQVHSAIIALSKIAIPKRQ